MGDGIKAWHDDMADYAYNCGKLGVKARYECYSDHAKWAEDKVFIAAGWRKSPVFPQFEGKEDKDFDAQGKVIPGYQYEI